MTQIAITITITTHTSYPLQLPYWQLFLFTMAKEQTYDVAFLPAVATDLVLGKRQIPSPGPGEVLIRNHAIAVNPVDWKRQSRGFAISSYPVVLGAGKSMAMLVKTSFLAGKLVSSPSARLSSPAGYRPMTIYRHQRHRFRSRSIGDGIQAW